MNNYLENVQSIWEEVEPELSQLRYEKWVDPILADKFDALINLYNGNIVSGSPTATLGKIESLTTMLSMDSYYRTRNTTEPEKKKLLLLNDNLLLLRQILVALQREEERNQAKPTVSADDTRLPNGDDSTKEYEGLYKEKEGDQTSKWNIM